MADIQPLESTHPDLAQFFQSICRCYNRYGKLVSMPSHGVVMVKGLQLVGGDGNIITVKEPGRNSPCPCGSGKKYKKCCGR